MKAPNLLCCGILSAAALLGGCFDDSTTGPASAASTRISYDGVTGPASLSAANAAVLLSGAYQGGQTGTAFGSLGARRDVDRRAEQCRRREGSGRVVDRDDVDLAGDDVLPERPQCGVLGVVPLLATVDEPDVMDAQVRSERLGDLVAVLGADDYDDPVDAGHGQGRPHAVREHRDAVEREQHLVAVGPDPAPGAGGEHDDRGSRARRTAHRCGRIIRTSVPDTSSWRSSGSM